MASTDVAERSAAHPGRPVEPATPAPAEGVTGALFGAISKLRGARGFHPIGAGYTGTLTVPRPVPGLGGVPLLASAGEHPLVVRFSRAAGLPEPWPDALGIAFRVPDLYGPGRHQDMLITSSLARPALHHVLRPARGFLDTAYTSILPYRVGGRLRMVGALPARDGGPPGLAGLAEAARAPGALFRLALAPFRGGWEPVAELHVTEPLPDDETEALALTPWNTGGGIRPWGPAMGLRRAAYRGSQRGRGLPAGDIP